MFVTTLTLSECILTIGACCGATASTNIYLTIAVIVVTTLFTVLVMWSCFWIKPSYNSHSNYGWTLQKLRTWCWHMLSSFRSGLSRFISHQPMGGKQITNTIFNVVQLELNDKFKSYYWPYILRCENGLYFKQQYICAACEPKPKPASPPQLHLFLVFVILLVTDLSWSWWRRNGSVLN